jgi:enoyl-[acyl-carrier protein] reductase I
MSGLLTGKRVLITGLISNKSIAYGIAEAMKAQGAELAFTYQTDKFSDRVTKMAQEFGSDLVFQCDVSSDEQIADLFKALRSKWDYLDGLVHSIAYAPGDQLEGDFVDVINRQGFAIAHDVSAYSFCALAQAAYPMMEGRAGAMLTLTYLGAERAVPNYNVMGLAKASLEASVRYLASSLGARGIRVNGISAGPIRTLAASGIKDFRKMLSTNAKVTPLRKNVDAIEVGNTAAFLCSDLASGITGEIVHVDAGYSTIGMSELVALSSSAETT